MATKKFVTTEVRQASGKLVPDSRALDVTGESIAVDKLSVNITDVIISFINAAALEKSNKEEKDKQADVLKKFSAEVRGYFTEKNNEYIKTLKLLGKKVGKLQHAVDVSNKDSFSMSDNKEDMKALKKLMSSYFDQIFEEVVTISIKKTIMENDKKRRELTKKLIDALGEDGVKEYFDRDTNFSVKSGLAEKFHTYPEDVRKILNDKLKQAADQVKDTSVIDSD